MSPLSASPPENFIFRFPSIAPPKASLFSVVVGTTYASAPFHPLLEASFHRSCLFASAQLTLYPRKLNSIYNLYFFFLRKEVIQPHLPIRLPCYDFTPVIGPAFGSSLLTVGSLTSGVADSHGVTGGVYKTRERIHRDILIRDY